VAVTREELLKFLTKKTRADLSKLDDETELFSSGLIDSFAMIDLMTWLEKQTRKRVDPSEVGFENFDTVGRILAYSAKLTG
jgi:acyl carrier protein